MGKSVYRAVFVGLVRAGETANRAASAAIVPAATARPGMPTSAPAAGRSRRSRPRSTGRAWRRRSPARAGPGPPRSAARRPRVQPGADGRQVERADRGQEQHREPDRTPYPGVPLGRELGEDDDPEHRDGHGARGYGFNPSASPAWRRIRVSAAETSWTGMTAVARWARARMSEASSSASRSEEHTS